MANTTFIVNTNFVTSAIELKMIKQWLKKTTSLSKTIKTLLALV